MSSPQFIRPQSTGLSGFGNAGVLLQAVSEAKTVSKFTAEL